MIIKDVDNHIIPAYSLNFSLFHFCPTHIMKADLVKLYFVPSPTKLAMASDHGLCQLI